MSATPKPPIETDVRGAHSLHRLVRRGHSCERTLATVLWRPCYPADALVWKCTCGKEWTYVEDEAEGGAWYPHDAPNK